MVWYGMVWYGICTVRHGIVLYDLKKIILFHSLNTFHSAFCTCNNYASTLIYIQHIKNGSQSYDPFKGIFVVLCDGEAEGPGWS